MVGQLLCDFCLGDCLGLSASDLLAVLSGTVEWLEQLELSLICRVVCRDRLGARHRPQVVREESAVDV